MGKEDENKLTYMKSLEEIKKELSHKQAERFRKLLSSFDGCDKLDIIYKLAKKKICVVRKL